MTSPVPPADETFVPAMQAALAEAEAAAALGEVPVGAVVLFEGRVVARAHNRRERACDPTGHAELIAIAGAARALGRWRLWGTTLVATLEPCAMCAGAIVNARVEHLVFGARDAKAGAVGSLFDIVRDPRLNHRAKVSEGLLASDCARVLQSFFRARRAARA